MKVQSQSECEPVIAPGLEETAAAQSVGDLTEADLIEIDLAYHHKKVSGEMQRLRERMALEEDIAAMRRLGSL